MLACFVLKNSSKISQTKYRLLRDLAKKMKKEQCYEIINNQLEAIFQSKKPVFSLYELYKIKTTVDFHFREYSGIQMNIANQIKIIQQITEQRNQMRRQAKNSEFQYTQTQHQVFIKDMKNLLHFIQCQLILVLSLSDHKRLKQYLKDKKTPIIPTIKNPQLSIGSDFMFKLLKAYGQIFVGNLLEGISQFLMLINSDQTDINEKELPFLCLIVLKSLQFHNNSQTQDTQKIKKSRNLMFKLIKNLGVDTNKKERIAVVEKDFESIDLQYCLNAWMSYRFDRPFQYTDQMVLNQFLGCVYFIAENKLLNRRYEQAMKDMQIICQNKVVQYDQLKFFLQLSSLYDRGNFKELIEKAENKFANLEQVTLPQWDKVTYDIYALTKKTYKKLVQESQNKKQLQEIQLLNDKIEEIQQASLIFKQINQLQTNHGLPWYYFPSFFRVIFAWPNPSNLNNQIQSKKPLTRRKNRRIQ